MKKRKKSHQHQNADSGNVEYYTPQPIIEAARAAMGSIDLDPASSERANQRVRAGAFYTKKSDGLRQDWFGNVWVNHPYGRDTNPVWIRKIVAQWESGHCRALCCITFANTSEKWFQPLARQPQCYLAPRTNFYLPNGKLKRGVTKGSVVTYFGPDVARFHAAFATLGVVKVPYLGSPL
jgi:hypothetical protein